MVKKITISTRMPGKSNKVYFQNGFLNSLFFFSLFACNTSVSIGLVEEIAIFDHVFIQVCAQSSMYILYNHLPKVWQVVAAGTKNGSF